MTGSEIVEVVSSRVRRTLPVPIVFGPMTISVRSYCRVQVRLRDGRVGRSFSLDRGIDVAAIVRGIVGPAYLAAASASTTEAWWHALRAASPAVASGAGLRALSLVDLAVVDAREEWPAATGPRPPLWVVIGYPPSMPPDQVAAEAVAAIKVGAAGVKVPASAERSRARLEAVVAAVGAERVAHDLAWGAADADAAARAVDGLDLAWLEDPFPPGNVSELRRLRRMLDVPLASGDEDGQLYHPLQLIEADAVDLVRLDATCQGGATRMRELDSAIAATGVPVSWHMNLAVHERLARGLTFRTASVELSGRGSNVDPLDERRALVPAIKAYHRKGRAA
jgi:L-alanine-DL-glutamate epimerase-like enolase superfamily enzyme